MLFKVSYNPVGKCHRKVQTKIICPPSSLVVTSGGDLLGTDQASFASAWRLLLSVSEAVQGRFISVHAH